MFRSARFQRLGKEFTWIMLGQATGVLGSLVGVRLLTELLDPTAYGELALVMTVATMANHTMFGALDIGITRFYAPAQEQGDLGNYLNAVRRLVLSATGVIILIIFLTVIGLLIDGRTKWIAIAPAALIVATLSGYNSILNNIQNAARQRSVVALHQGMEPWARYLFAAALILWMGATSISAIVGYATALILVLGSQYVFFRKFVFQSLTAPDKEKSWQNQIWKYSCPFSIFGIFTWVQLASDRWALEFFTTTREVGLYAVLLQLGYYPMSMATGMAMTFLAPIFYQRAGDASDYQRIASVNSLSWRLTGLSMGVTCAAFLFAFIFHTQIFRIFVAKEYWSVSHLLPWLMLAGGVFAAGQTISLNLMSQMKVNTMIPAKIVTAILAIILNVAGAYWYGATGIVIAAILFAVSYFFWMSMLSKQRIKIANH